MIWSRNMRTLPALALALLLACHAGAETSYADAEADTMEGSYGDGRRLDQGSGSGSGLGSQVPSACPGCGTQYHCTPSGEYTFTYVGDNGSASHTYTGSDWPSVGTHNGQAVYTKAGEPCYGDFEDSVWPIVHIGPPPEPDTQVFCSNDFANHDAGCECTPDGDSDDCVNSAFLCACAEAANCCNSSTSDYTDVAVAQTECHRPPPGSDDDAADDDDVALGNSTQCWYNLTTGGVYNGRYSASHLLMPGCQGYLLFDYSDLDDKGAAGDRTGDFIGYRANLQGAYTTETELSVDNDGTVELQYHYTPIEMNSPESGYLVYELDPTSDTTDFKAKLDAWVASGVEFVEPGPNSTVLHRVLNRTQPGLGTALNESSPFWDSWYDDLTTNASYTRCMAIVSACTLSTLFYTKDVEFTVACRVGPLGKASSAFIMEYYDVPVNITAHGVPIGPSTTAAPAPAPVLSDEVASAPTPAPTPEPKYKSAGAIVGYVCGAIFVFAAVALYLYARANNIPMKDALKSIFGRQLTPAHAPAHFSTRPPTRRYKDITLRV